MIRSIRDFWNKLLLKMQNETKTPQVHKSYDFKPTLRENEVKSNNNSTERPSISETEVEPNESVFNKYVGKKVYRKRDGMIGIIEKTEGNYVYIKVIDGPKVGKTIEVMVEFLAAGNIYDIED